MAPARFLCTSFLILGLLPLNAAAAAGSLEPLEFKRSKAVGKILEKIKQVTKDDERYLQNGDAAAQEEADRLKKTAHAACAFALLQATNFLARTAFQIHSLAKLCPQSAPGQVGYSTPLKGCLISSASLITSMSQIAAGISVATSKCSGTVNQKALCAAPSAALFSPATVFISASTVASAACAQAAAELPPAELWTPARRLSDARKWEIGACVIDATSAVMALGQIALGFDGATRSCPAVKEGDELQQKKSVAACTVNAGFTFFSVARLMAFFALAVSHCIPGTDNDAACVAACSGLASAGFAVTWQGASVYTNCIIPTLNISDVRRLRGQDRPSQSSLGGPANSGTFAEMGPSRNSSDSTSSSGSWLRGDRQIEKLARKVGFNPHLTTHDLVEELAKESDFETGEDLWLSMGYNFSDPTAAWHKEDPEGAAIIEEGRQMIKELQTTREEPTKELLEHGPEEVPLVDVPEVPVDPSDEASTLSCSERGATYDLDLPGHAVSLERGAAACQARCARTAGCARFSYWPPQHHCRLHGVLAGPVPGQPPWISGPPGCREPQVSKATQRMLDRKRTCYHPHAVYEPRDSLAAPQPAASIEACQRRCQQAEGCAHFVYSELDGECSLADGKAVKLQPVLYHIAGPKYCPNTAPTFSGLAAVTRIESEDLDPHTSFRAAYRPTDAVAVACAVSGVVFAVWVVRATSRRLYSSIVQREQTIE